MLICCLGGLCLWGWMLVCWCFLIVLCRYNKMKRELLWLCLRVRWYRILMCWRILLCMCWVLLVSSWVSVVWLCMMNWIMWLLSWKVWLCRWSRNVLSMLVIFMRMKLIMCIMKCCWVWFSVLCCFWWCCVKWRLVRLMFIGVFEFFLFGRLKGLLDRKKFVFEWVFFFVWLKGGWVVCL